MVETPALQDKYKIIKSIVHVSVECTLVLQSMIKNQEKTIRHAQDLRIINKQMHGMKRIIKEDMEEHLPNICKILKHIRKIRMVQHIDTLPCIKTQLLNDIQSINDAYRDNATNVQWNGMATIVDNWRMKHRIKLDRTRILLACAKGPKKNLLELQLFRHLYEEEGLSTGEDSDYILDYEMLPQQLSSVSIDCLIRALKSKLLNEQLAVDMLHGNLKGMEEDVLGVYANRRRTLAKQCPYKVSTSRHSLFAGEKKLNTLQEHPPKQGITLE